MVPVMKREKIPVSVKLILAIYTTGIIVGGGILALPFVALDSGILFLIAIMVILAIIFNVIYWRILEGVSINLTGEISASELGLLSYDKALEKSGLRKWGRIAFSIGIFLYVYPADIVYMLYGLKSIIELSKYFYESYIIPILVIILIVILNYVVLKFYEKRKSDILALIIKLLLMSLIWLISITLIAFYRMNMVVISAFSFAISLIIGEYLPEHIYGESDIQMILNNVDKIEIIPRHSAQSILTVFKLMLIILVPLAAFVLITSSVGLNFTTPLWPNNYISLVDSFSVLVFMYVGSGVYNILIYPWVVKNLKEGKKIVSVGVVISLIVYMIFTLIILSIVDYNILMQSDINREHAFISLSRKLGSIGLSYIAYLVIGLAALFALVSVSVAYIGFTDTLSERLELDLEVRRERSWFLITIIVLISTILLELFQVSKIATDALGVAGNAGGGLFLLTLPWLINTNNDEGKILIAMLFLVTISIVNLIMFLSATTLVAKVSALIATILVITFGGLSIVEKIRSPK